MGAPVVIVLTHGTADAIADEAIDHLAEFVRGSLVRPLWTLTLDDLDETVTACKLTTDGESFVGLLTSVADVVNPCVARVVTVATSALDAAAVVDLARGAERVVAALRGARAATTAVVDVRLVAPQALVQPTPLVELLSSAAQVNLVIVPEDRHSDVGFAVPVGTHDTATYAAHVAVEVATHAGLWIGMDEAPVDSAKEGVIDHGDCKVVIARSFVRVAVGPPLPLQDAMAATGKLPAPRDADPAPAPTQAALGFADHLFDNAEALQYAPPPEFTPTREKLTLRQSIVRIFREARTYVARLPRNTLDGALADLHHVAAEALTEGLGEDSRIEVDWRGRVGDDLEAGHPFVDPTELQTATSERRALSDASSFDQQLWSRLVDDVLSAVDAGPTANDTNALALGSQRIAIVDPAAIGPDPTAGREATVATISTEALQTGHGTLLGRLSARIRADISRADIELDTALGRYSEDFQQKGRPRVGVASILTWVLAGLVAATVALAAIGGRLAEVLGVAGWSTTTRTIVGIVVAVVALGVAGVSLAAALRGQGEARKVAWRVVGATFAVGALASLLMSGDRWHLGPTLKTIHVDEALLTLTVLAIVVEVIVFCFAEKTPRGRAATRVSGAVLVVYLTIVTIGSVVRHHGWYHTVDGDGLWSFTLRGGAVLVALTICTILVIAALRVRERLMIATTAARLRWSAKAAGDISGELSRLHGALDQYHNTAVAIDRLVWWPFGRPEPGVTSEASEQEITVHARKMQLFPYSFSERGRKAVLARIRSKIAENGWVQRQYGTAVEAFRPDFAEQTGRAPDAVARRRPETDASTDQISRLTFASMLFDGSFDGDLRSAGARLAMDDVFEQYFQRADGLAVARQEHSSVASFAGALVAGQQTPLPAAFFDRMSAPVADDGRARFRSTLWWPTAAIPSPATDAAVRESRIEHERGGNVVLSFVRADWSQEFALRRLPISLEAPDVAFETPDLIYALVM